MDNQTQEYNITVNQNDLGVINQMLNLSISGISFLRALNTGANVDPSLPPVGEVEYNNMMALVNKINSQLPQATVEEPQK